MQEQKDDGALLHNTIKGQSSFNLFRAFPSPPQLLSLHLAGALGERKDLTCVSIPGPEMVKTAPGFLPRAISCHVPLTSQGWYGMEPSLTLSASRFTARKSQSRGLNTRAHETFLSPTTLFLSRISLADFPASPCQLPSQQLVKTLSLQLKLDL